MHFRCATLPLVVKVGMSALSSSRPACILLTCRIRLGVSAHTACWSLTLIFLVMIPNILFCVVSPLQMVRCQKGNGLRSARCLHLVSSVHPLHPGHLHLLLSLETPSRLGQKPNRARTSVLPWQLPCSSSSRSRTRMQELRSTARTLLRLLMLRPGDNPHRPGWQTLHLNLHLHLRPQQDQWLLLLQLQHNSQRTRTSAFPMELPADPQSPCWYKSGYHGMAQVILAWRKSQRDTYRLWLTGPWAGSENWMKYDGNECLNLRAFYRYGYKHHCPVKKLRCFAGVFDLGLVWVSDSHHWHLSLSSLLKVLTWMKFNFQIECQAADTQLWKQLFCPPPWKQLIISTAVSTFKHQCFTDATSSSQSDKLKLKHWWCEGKFKAMSTPIRTLEDPRLASFFQPAARLWPQLPLNDFALVGRCELSFCFGRHFKQCISAALH